MKSTLKNGHFGRDEQGYGIRLGVAVLMCKERWFTPERKHRDARQIEEATKNGPRRIESR
jgi:hypothetical protein